MGCRGCQEWLARVDAALLPAATLTPHHCNTQPQVQMTLSVHRMQDMAHASAQQPRTAASAGTGAAPSPTPRLLTGCADSLPRLTSVLGAMCGDLLGRVMLDRCVWVGMAGSFPSRRTGWDP
jgi:hypothetical protein